VFKSGGFQIQRSSNPGFGTRAAQPRVAGRIPLLQIIVLLQTKTVHFDSDRWPDVFRHNRWGNGKQAGNFIPSVR
jgi:hypothetical protein